MSRTRVLTIVGLGVMLAATICVALVWATTGSGTSSTLLGRGTFDESVKVERETRGANQAWEVEV